MLWRRPGRPVARRAAEVFISALVVELAIGDLITSAYSLKFWQEIAAAALVAALAELLGLLAAESSQRPPAPPGPPDEAPRDRPGTDGLPHEPGPEN